MNLAVKDVCLYLCIFIFYSVHTHISCISCERCPPLTSHSAFVFNENLTITHRPHTFYTHSASFPYRLVHAARYFILEAIQFPLPIDLELISSKEMLCIFHRSPTPTYP